MRRIFTLIAVCIVACHAAEEKRPTIPGGVRYHFADDTVVAAARNFIAERFSRGEPGVRALFVGECMCAPGLWRLVSSSDFKRPELRKFTIPNRRTGITYNLDGAHLTAASDLKSIARFVAAEIGPHPDVRRLTTEEISKFWVVVPFDIEEPLFVVSSGSRQLVLCLKATKVVIGAFGGSTLYRNMISDRKQLSPTKAPDRTLTIRPLPHMMTAHDTPSLFRVSVGHR